MNAHRFFALSLLLAGSVGAAQADDGLSRAQVRAETLAAARAGQIPHGDLDQRAPAPESASSTTRAEVRAELERAIARGELEVGESGRTQRDLEPGRYAQAPAAAGLSRAEVRRELAAAIRRGELPQGDLDRTQAERAPQRFASAPARSLHAAM